MNMTHGGSLTKFPKDDGYSTHFRLDREHDEGQAETQRIKQSSE